MSNIGMWKHAKGTPGFFWNVKFGVGEGVANTGPNIDATGDGYFLIADSSKRKREDRAVIISDELTPAPKVNRACLKFRYFMHGSNMGLLSVKIKRGIRSKPKTIWRAFQEAGRQWKKAKVTLKSSVKFQVLFDAAIGEPEKSDIALDNIYVDSGSCKCQDEYQSCREWALDKKCNSKNDKTTYYWMSKNCKKSCETCDCKDLAGLKDCRRWEKTGLCSTSSAWMSVHCQLSCRLCACHDSLDYSNCKARVSAFECETHPQLMADECRLSCGFCDCKNIATEEECHRRMTLGECASNELYMNTNCKHSCGYCNCKNRHSKCKLWASQGECTKNPLWMEANCTLSCGKCRCHDTKVDCKKWKDQGECSKNSLYMNAFCQKSCGICKV
ncbi:MAM and LDL-receptor class A domain-containing protein 2-like [Dendronephthya gigantea]|uniref:MAM and LDL-receptor class A domain-containing protein 2-like n=1 Tax=Dendronephthya gigantea TaxID=151771 RepID=UPI00106957BA|nr:MAM and LDL-receptor class A domain-containing protein 2-like [Dendronephthya gigantea]